MSTTVAAEREQLLEAAIELGRSALVVGSLGNVSVRVGSGCCITPSMLPYERMTVDDLVTLDADGIVIDGDRAPSREAPLHREIYAARPDVGAIVHTHSPRAVAWSFLGDPLAPPIEELDYYGIGAVGVSLPARAGTAHVGAAAVEGLGDGAAVLLARHGVVTVADEPGRALTIARVIEHHAEIAWLLRTEAR